jgi:hypothetical protein
MEKIVSKECRSNDDVNAADTEKLPAKLQLCS